MPFIILTIYNIYFIRNNFSWQVVGDHQTFNSVNYSERCLLDDIAFNYLQTVLGPSFLEKIYHAKLLLIMLTFFKMILYLKNVLFPMLIHTRFLSVQFNKKASFFRGSFPFYIINISNIDLDTNVKIRKFLFGENAFVDLFAVRKFIESIVANLPRTLLKTCSAI